MVGLAVVAALVAAAACSGSDAARDDPDEERPQTEPPGWELVDEPAALEPLAFEQEPLWTDESAGPFQDLAGAAFRGDDLVLSPGIGRGDSLGVLDAATGEVRWSVDLDRDLPGGGGAELSVDGLRGPVPAVVERAEGWAVVVPARDPDGVAALSGDDGHVIWQTPVGDDHRTPKAIYVIGGVAVVEVAGHDYEPGSNHYTDPRLVAVDTADGTILWERDGLGADGVAGETVLAYTPETESPTGSVVALNAATGEVRWDLSDRYPQSWFELAARDLAAVTVPRSEPPDAPQLFEVLVVDASSGREVASFGTTATGCAADDELIACAVGVRGPGPRPAGEDQRLATFDVDDREGTVAEATLPDDVRGRDIHTVVEGRIVIDQGPHRPAVSLDRFANTIDTRLPGRVLAMSDRYAICRVRNTGAYTVHRITP